MQYIFSPDCTELSTKSLALTLNSQALSSICLSLIQASDYWLFRSTELTLEYQQLDYFHGDLHSGI